MIIFQHLLHTLPYFAQWCELREWQLSLRNEIDNLEFLPQPFFVCWVHYTMSKGSCSRSIL